MKDQLKPPRRFYRAAAIVGRDAGFGVDLDARALRTPGGALFVAPTEALAQLCADEWNAQGENIMPASMPVSQMAFATLDWTAKQREKLADYIASFGATDLCCHRAESPAELVERQARTWDPIVDWAAETLGARLLVVTGIVAAPEQQHAIAKLRAEALALDDHRLTALAQATGLAGSALIGFGVVKCWLTPDRAFRAAALDHLWSLEKWGEDEEARARVDRQHHELSQITRYLEALA